MMIRFSRFPSTQHDLNDPSFMRPSYSRRVERFSGKFSHVVHAQHYHCMFASSYPYELMCPFVQLFILFQLLVVFYVDIFNDALRCVCGQYYSSQLSVTNKTVNACCRVNQFDSNPHKASNYEGETHSLIISSGLISQLKLSRNSDCHQMSQRRHLFNCPKIFKFLGFTIYRARQLLPRRGILCSAVNDLGKYS